MHKTPAKEFRRPACTLSLKRFMQVHPSLSCNTAVLRMRSLRTRGTQAPILDFGVIKLGASKSLECSVKNLDQQEQQVDSPNTFMRHIQNETCVLFTTVTGPIGCARCKSFKYLKVLMSRSTVTQQDS